MATAIGLSLGLFSLSLLEAAPSSWLILLSHEETSATSAGMNLTRGILKISRVYWLLFWALSIMILVIAPSLAGATLADSFRGLCFSRKNSSSGANDPDSRKYSTWKNVWRSSPWWIRFFGGILHIVTRNMWRLCRRVCLRRRNPPPPPELVMSRTLSEDELRLVDSGDLEFQGLVSSPRTTAATNSGDHFWMIVGGLVGVFSVVVTVSSIGPLVVHTTTDMSILSVIVSWLCAIGLLISSLLNGFGSVSMPYSYLAGLYLTPVRNEVITKLESELQSVREATAKKRVTLREMTVAIKQGGSNNGSGGKKPKPTPTFAAKVWSTSFSGIGEELGNRRQILQTEINFLDALCKDMKADIEELRYSQSLAAAARTSMGKVRSYVGLIFSVILLVRLGSAGMSIWQSYTMMDTSRQKVAHGDIVTTGLLWLSGHDFVSQKDFTMLSQVVSLAVTALLTFSQVRFFFRTVAAVHRRLSRFYQSCYCGVTTTISSSPSPSDDRQGLGALTSGLLSQVLAGATGCYFLSCIVLIKMMLPEDFCKDFASAMGGTDFFSIHASVVNTVYACSAGVSLAILGMLFGIQRQNNVRHTSAAKNEGGISIALRGADLV